MPMHADFRRRLFPILPQIVKHFNTPFHIYDEVGIRRTGEALKSALSTVDSFKEYFAVKALPNPRILEIMRDMQFGLHSRTSLGQAGGSKRECDHVYFE